MWLAPPSVKAAITIEGTDAQGEQVDLQEQATLDDSGNDDVADDETLIADGTTSTAANDNYSGTAEVTDFLKGSLSTIDPTTRIKTTSTYNDLAVAIAQDADDGNETTDSDSGSDTVDSDVDETTARTNPDGTPASAPVTYDNSVSDTETWLNGVTTDQGSAAVPASAAVGAPVPAVGGAVIAGDTAAQANTAGGDAVTITGTGFTADSQVSFDGVAAQSLVVVSSTEIVAITPAESAGNADATVANAAGTSAASPNDRVDFADSAQGNGGETTQNSSSGSSSPGNSPQSTATEPDGSIMGGGGWNPLNWLGMLAYPTLRNGANGIYGVWSSDLVVRDMERQREATLQQGNSVADDAARQQMRQRNMKPVPASYNSLIQDVEVAAAGMYGSRPGGVTPNPRAVAITGGRAAVSGGAAAAQAAETKAAVGVAEIVRTENKSRVVFQGMEFRAVRDLSHLDEGRLRAMAKEGFAAKDINGKTLGLHHLDQNPAGPVVEMPAFRNNVNNRVQHPQGNTPGAGLTDAQRASFNAMRESYWKARAIEELLVRGLTP